jgi:hypothetical protein
MQYLFSVVDDTSDAGSKACHRRAEVRPFLGV